jgi:putative ABC transport system permease protein
MIRNYLVTAARNFAHNKLYSFINVAGLSVGLACAILIVLFLRDELSYDKWIPQSENLYRTEVSIALPGRELMKLAVSPFPMANAMRDGIPEVTAMTRLVPERMVVTFGNRHFYASVAVVDPNFLQVIKLPLVQGDPAAVFAHPESIVLSQTAARKYFGDTDPLGQTITVSASSADDSGKTAARPLTVTGILRDLPHNTQLDTEAILPNTSLADNMAQQTKHDWTSQQGFGYVSLAPNADLRKVVAKLKTIIDADLKGIPELQAAGSDFEQPHLTPFQQVHLTTDNYIGGGARPPGSWTTICGFAVIAALIVLVACFNFMNMATARATLRAREISLRKSVGATRRQLIVQFLGEAVMTSLVALVVALALVEVLLPAFDHFLQRPIAFHYLEDWQLFLAIISTAIAAGLISGVYPAVVLSRVRPGMVLRANASGQTGAGLTRMALVVLQFAVSIGLGIAAVVVFRQINFAQHSDLGFNRDGVVAISGGNNLTPSARESFAHKLAEHAGISGVAQSNVVPFQGSFTNRAIQLPGESQVQVFRVMDISPEFPDLYRIPLLAGRLLSAARGEDALAVNIFAADYANSRAAANDNANVLINAEAARRLGWTPAGAVGKTVIFDLMHVQVVGVLGDPKVDGLKGPVLPMVYVYNSQGNSVFSVRIRERGAAETLSYIDTTWRSFAPTLPVERHFLSEAFDNLFKEDERQAQIFSLFVSIAIFIACLGLFGLAAFTAQRRTKEIGVRKVFGARQTDIVLLLLWQFSVPVLIANVIAWPVTYYYLHHWLESYAYRVALSPLYFVLAGATALVIAWITVIAHAWLVARANPIHALRYE